MEEDCLYSSSSPFVLQKDTDECEICGRGHTINHCNILNTHIIHIEDTPTPSYARLSLPHGLEVREMGETKTVFATKPFPKGVQFGPFIAKTSTLVDVRIDYPLKVFLSEDESVYLETYEETFCNWMCFINLSENCDELNLFCYQVKKSIYFCTFKEIKKGQELKAWYAPHYAEKMGASVQNMVHSSDEEFQEIVRSLESGAEANVDNKVQLKKKKKKRAWTNPTSRKECEGVVALLPGELLGVREQRKEWQCQDCGLVETSVAMYARHLMTHCLPLSLEFFCPFCDKRFKKEGYNREMHLRTCKARNNNVERVADSTDTINNNVDKSSNLKNLANHETAFKSMENEIPNMLLENKNLFKEKPINSNNNLTSISESIKCKISTSIFDLSDDIDFNMIDSFEDLTSEGSSLEKSSLVSKGSRNLDLSFEFAPQSIVPCLDVSTFYSHDKTGFLPISFTSCEDVTDEEKNRIVESLLLDTDSKFQNSDYEVTDGCVSEDPEADFNISSGKENQEHGKRHNKKTSKKVGDFKCDICDKWFRLQKYLYRHLKKHAGEYVCTMCYQTFARKETLISHKENCMHTTSTQQSNVRFRMTCKICKMHFHSVDTLREHLEGHYCKGELWRCCCGMVSDKAELITSHPCPLSRRVSCSNCHKLLLTPQDFIVHRNREILKPRLVKKEMSLICELCGVSCKSVTGARLHRIQHGEKRYQCEICDKKFYRKDTMINHRSQHVKAEFECRECKKKFTSGKKLEVHFRRVHQKSQWTCPHCDKVYSLKWNLEKHMKTHGRGSISCKFCKKMFENLETYTVHLAEVHKGNVCPFCNKQYSKRGQLKRHISLLHKRRYLCSFCGINISYIHTLKRHLMLKHSDRAEEWDSPDALNSMMLPVNGGLNGTAFDSDRGVVDIPFSFVENLELPTQAALQQPPSQPLHKEGMLNSSQDDLSLPTNEETPIVNLPLSIVPVGCQIALDNREPTDEDTTLITTSSEQDDLSLPTNKETPIVNLPLSIIPVGCQIAIDDREPTEKDTTLITISSEQGADSFILFDGSIVQPNFMGENNVLYYVVESSVVNSLT